MSQLIDRPIYTSRITPFINKGIIKVLTGQRRVGKSCIMKQLMRHIKESVSNANIIYINKEYEVFNELKSHEDLSSYVLNRLKEDCPNYLFIDEVQDITGFEHTLRSLQARNSCDIFVTGSNASMLSGELATYLSGRYIEFHIHSLGFSEFLQFHKLDPSVQALRSYLSFGGMPYLTNLPLEKELVFEYLSNVYSTILLKDVVKREGIRNVDFLETLAVYIADNVGNLFSANNISKYLKSQHVNISSLQVGNYIKSLRNAYLINRAQRLEIEGLRKFEIHDKYFFEDLGLRNCHLNFSLQRDIHKLMENAVYNHLRLLNYSVFTGEQTSGREIDFIGLKNEWRIYAQVAYRIESETTKNREFGNLLAIRDNYPKYVISMDEWTSGSNVDGIMHIHLIDFLMRTEL